MADNSYYYIKGKKREVKKEKNLIAVCFHSRASKEEVDSFSTSRSSDLKLSDKFSEIQQSNIRIYKTGDRSAVDFKNLRDSFRSESEIENIGEVYTDDTDRPLVLTDEIVCKFKPELSLNEIEELEKKYDFDILQKLTFSENAFVLKLNPESKKDALEIANALREEENSIYSYPNWIEYIGYRQETVETRHGIHPTDANFAQQWHLENTGQTPDDPSAVAGTLGADISAPLAWQTTMGNPNIRLAVIDGGVDIQHNDFSAPGKSVSPIDLIADPPDNNPRGGSHGTKVAGMAVAAANNNCGVVGSAPNCRLIAIKAGDTMAQIRMAEGFIYAADNGADVITCSLGPVGAWPLTDALEEAIEYATTYGRNGRGCVYTHAVSNSNEPISNDEVCSHERSIAVSRTNNTDTYDGAATGPELDISAPGRYVLTTTNTTSSDRCATDTTTGTSFATPLTAGVACLVLSVNPDLSWEEVRQVLLDSANKIDAATFPYVNAPANRPPGTRNNNLGYGRVNAQNAVQIAQQNSPQDLYIRDNFADTGEVPSTGAFWDTPDIWVRNNDDGQTTHQDTIRGRDNFIYARVHNRGTEPSHPCWVRFYMTTYAGTQFRYPFDFKRDTTAERGGGTPGNLKDRSSFPLPASYFVGVQRIQSIPDGSNIIAKVRWEKSLIPPAANWHPCLLVEISPHDGPNPTGQNVWDNNNLGQKNIKIVNARRGQLLTLPFKFYHQLAWKESIISLDIYKKIPRNWKMFLDVQDETLVKNIAKHAKLKIDTGIVGTKPTIPFKVPWKFTFLDTSKIIFSPKFMQREEEDNDGDTNNLMFTFQPGSSIEMGSEASTEFEEDITEFEEEREFEFSSVSALPFVRPTKKPTFEIAKLSGANVLALKSTTNVNKIQIPMLKSGIKGQKDAAIKIAVPKNAIVGESYNVDVVERNSKGQIVGGITIQVHVTG